MSGRYLSIAGAVVMTAFSSPAFAQMHYEISYQAKPIPPILIVLAIAVAILLLILHGLNAGWFSSGSSGPCNCPDCTGARYEQEARLFREITRHQDAHTSMMRSEIEHARTIGEYRERPDIAEHEQKLREMRSRLN